MLDLVPAKIDTGADVSAIWASNINEKDGELSFILFEPYSSFYTGGIIKTRNYSVANVKNSFGDSEYRYKVMLSVKIANKTYKSFFNLADRSHSRFPILLGRNFLKNRFVVDVASRDIDGVYDDSSLNHPIVILKSRIDERIKEFFDLVSKQVSSEIILNDYISLRFEINEDGVPKIILPDGKDLATARLVYFKSHNLYPEYAGAVVKYLQYKHVPFVDKEVAGVVSTSKLSELFILATNGVSVPQTEIFCNGNVPSYSELCKTFGNKMIIKDAYSDRGKNNFLIKDADSYFESIDRLKDVKTFVIQRFIENDGFLRVLIMGKKVIQVVKRTTSVHKDPLRAHLNKPHGSANASELLPGEYGANVVALARRAALAMQRNIAGVDLIQDKNSQKWYVLEANNNPETIKGINVSKKISGLANFLQLQDK
jgi:glutathione synthase/RimK-type ligase-like ATP-grasp enzyme